jgi:hypothetical protein
MKKETADRFSVSPPLQRQIEIITRSGILSPTLSRRNPAQIARQYNRVMELQRDQETAMSLFDANEYVYLAAYVSSKT